jgi:hypothetical protein
MKTFSGIGMLTSEIGHFVEFLDLFPAADQPLVMGEALWGQPPGARLWPCHWSGVLKGHDFGGCGKTGRAGEKLTAGAKARMYFGLSGTNKFVPFPKRAAPEFFRSLFSPADKALKRFGL